MFVPVATLLTVKLDLHKREGGRSMRVCVLGASGRTGRLVIDVARARGHEVVALNRRHLPGLDGLTGVTQAVAAPEGRSTVEELIAGCDAVISALGPRRGSRAGDLVALVDRAARAAREADNLPFVLVSAAPVADPPQDEGLIYRRIAHPLVQRVFGTQYRELAEMEAALQATHHNWVIVRPPRLLDAPATEYRSQLDSAVTGGRSITRAALAHVLVDALEQRPWSCRVVGVSGT